MHPGINTPGDCDAVIRTIGAACKRIGWRQRDVVPAAISVMIRPFRTMVAVSALITILDIYRSLFIEIDDDIGTVNSTSILHCYLNNRGFAFLPVCG